VKSRQRGSTWSRRLAESAARVAELDESAVVAQMRIRQQGADMQEAYLSRQFALSMVGAWQRGLSLQAWVEQRRRRRAVLGWLEGLMSDRLRAAAEALRGAEPARRSGR
jgi:hypothetical protein